MYSKAHRAFVGSNVAAAAAIVKMKESLRLRARSKQATIAEGEQCEELPGRGRGSLEVSRVNLVYLILFYFKVLHVTPLITVTCYSSRISIGQLVPNFSYTPFASAAFMSLRFVNCLLVWGSGLLLL